MKLELEVYGALCETRTFKINGIEAEYEDFGSKYDTAPEVAELYSCGDMQFVPIDPKKEVLEKYNITKEEYEEICQELRDKLSFGCCCWCS